MRKFYLILCILGMLFVGGCTSGSSSGRISGLFGGFGGSNSADVPEQIISGEGLEVDFNIDDSRIKAGKLIYEVSIENTGKDEIRLTRENFVLDTNKAVDIITSDSMNKFYETVLQNSELVVYNGQSIELGGVLEVSEIFLKESLLSDFELRLNVFYPYETEFSNNLDFDLSFTKGSDLMRVTDKVSQAAPVQIEKMELIPDLNNKYALDFYFDDSANGMSSEKLSIKIENFKAVLGTKDISSSCIPVYMKGSDYVELKSGEFILNSEKGDLVAHCVIEFDDSNGDKFSTKVQGSFKYNYKIRLTETVRMPERKIS